MDIIAWSERDLPAEIEPLLREAAGSGHDWVADLRPAWRAGPFTGDGEALLLAWEGADLLAMAAISADPFVEGGATGRLRFIYVRESARRRGIADRLVAGCLARAAGRWKRLRLHTDNPDAARLYARHGFRPAPGEVRATHVMEMSASAELSADASQAAAAGRMPGAG